jgi:hypothetical protein
MDSKWHQLWTLKTVWTNPKTRDTVPTSSVKTSMWYVRFCMSVPKCLPFSIGHGRWHQWKYRRIFLDLIWGNSYSAFCWNLCRLNINAFQDGILKGEVSLYRWPPAWRVGNSSMKTEKFCFYLLNRLIQTGQTGGQWYSVPFSIPCFQHQTFIDIYFVPGKPFQPDVMLSGPSVTKPFATVICECL